MAVLAPRPAGFNDAARAAVGAGLAGAAAAGWAVMAASSYLGGSLVYRHRTGVDLSGKELEPRQFTAVLAEGELGTEPRRALAHGVAVVLARVGGSIYDAGTLQELGQALQTRRAQLRRSRLVQARHWLKRETLRRL